LATNYVNGSTYTAKAYATIDGTQRYLGNLIITIGKEMVDTSRMGLLFIFLLTFVFASIGFFNPVVALILTPIPILLGAISGLIAISVPVAIGIMVASFIVIFIIGGRL
jgi:hypothetical protein